jgi:hypothetical protein
MSKFTLVAGPGTIVSEREGKMRSRLMVTGVLVALLSAPSAVFAQTNDQNDNKKAGAVVPEGGAAPAGGALPAGGAAGAGASGFSIGTPYIVLGVAAVAGIVAVAVSSGGSNHNTTTPTSTSP